MAAGQVSENTLFFLEQPLRTCSVVYKLGNYRAAVSDQNIDKINNLLPTLKGSIKWTDQNVGYFLEKQDWKGEFLKMKRSEGLRLRAEGHST